MPFAIGSGGEFLPAPPPGLRTWGYALSVAETTAFGRQHRTFRSQDQTATVAVWYAKNHYDFWRPFHAIRLADADRNPFTQADPSWASEHIVPPLQEYPSAHAIQCQAIARTLRSVLGTDRLTCTTQSTTALPSNPVRSFTRWSAASRECRESRIMAGERTK